jgi:predicted porin
MKNILIAAGILITCSSVTHAQSSVTMYGIVDEFLDVGNNGSNTVPRLQSGGVSGSRLGFKGVEDLGGGMKGIFALEMGINADDGTSGQGGILFGRQAWVGVSTRGGDATLGRQYSPYFLTLVTYGLGTGMGWGNASTYFTDPGPLRVNNSIAYVSPAINGFTFRELYGFGENTTLPGNTTIGSVHSGSVQYDNRSLSANVSYVRRNTAINNKELFMAAGVSYDFGVMKVGLLAQIRRDDINANQNNALELNTLIPLSGSQLLLDAGLFKNRSVSNANAKAFSVRYDYFLSKRSTLYAGVATIKNDANATFGIGGSTSAKLNINPGNDPRSLVLGIRHTF